MNQKKVIAILSVILFAVVSGILTLLLSDNDMESRNKDRMYTSGSSIKEQVKNSSVFLYFGDRKRPYLISEERIISHPENPVVFGEIILGELIKGSNSGLMRTLPVDTTLRALYITKDKTAYVDFSRELSDGHPGGATMENLTVYSIVNSLALNIPGIESVKILVNGQEAETLAGHINLMYPMQADMLIVR